MPLIIIPTHSKWTNLKKKHEIADGAVSGIDLGKALDAYDSKAKTGVQFAAQNATAAAELEKILANYLKKLDKKKVKKDYAGFEKTFLNDYIGAAHQKAEDFKRYAADKDTYSRELLKFFGAIQQLVPGKTTVTDLGKFKSGPLRGLSAVGSSLKGHDVSGIDAIAAKLQKAIDLLPANATPPIINSVVAAIIKGGEDIGAEAKKQGLR